ncbi:Gfo/Idh/MocA family protein [Terriglobus tenax]|uniref:Gfo/Idh/MocA family protein n=1 Tax=Terriglobus tenax TaxID=1111115 RepID=UPI0021E0CECF|nr:Gfo/Idh/MocA family oxidoreductase [Terriglobus tenax]
MSSNKRLTMGLVGPGFIAPHHIDAVRRLGDVEVVAVAGSNPETARKKADLLHVRDAYGDFRELIARPDIDVIHNTTPNHLHFPVSLAALEAGKHVVSDKPVAMTSKEAATLRAAAASAGVVNAVTFNYRGNPLVQQMRLMIEQDKIGRLFFVHGQYLQDWMTDDHVYSWRSDPAKGGVSSALADIGSHWCDLAQHVSGARIIEVLADMTTIVKTRYTSGASAEAFSQNNSGEKYPVTVEGEDLASVLVRFDNGARGCFTVAQVLPGHKNGLEIELNGRAASLRWVQEEQNEIWIGHHDRPNETLKKDPSLMLAGAASYASLPGGHQEGWPDAFRNIIADIYQWIRTGNKPATVCTFADAEYTMRVLDAMLASHEAGSVWKQVQLMPGESTAPSFATHNSI